MFDVTPPSAQNHPASRGGGAAEGEGTGMRRGQRHRSCPEQAPAARSYSLPLHSEPAVHVFTQLCLPASLYPAIAQQMHLWVSISAGAPPGEVGTRTSPPTWEVSVFSTTHKFLIKFGSVTTLLWFAGDELWLKEIARVDVKEWTNSVST